MRKVLFAIATMATAALGISTAGQATQTVGAAAHARVTTPTCPTARLASPSQARAVGLGHGLWGSAAGALTRVGGSVPLAVSPEGGRGVVRHVFTRPGVGTAYVRDRRGGDVVVHVTGDGVERFAQDDEVFHPSLSARGDLAWSIGSVVRIQQAGAAEVGEIDAPRRGSTVFAPVFVSARALVAVVSAPPNDANPEGARQDNLFALDAGNSSWRAITHFRSRGDRWTAIRTPVVTRSGAIEFVRVSADASEAVEPTFELWRVRPAGHAHRMRVLDREMYLAGTTGGDRLWNIPASQDGPARVFREVAAGNLVDVGCGSVATDPVDVVDPDLRARRGSLVPPRGDWPGLDDRDTSAAELPEAAILVGDFVERAAAEDVVAAISAAYPGSIVELADSTTSPLAIRPGVWGAILQLPEQADPTAALAEFRRKLPAYRETSWVVTP